jgi:putative membrane protein
MSLPASALGEISDKHFAEGHFCGKGHTRYAMLARGMMPRVTVSQAQEEQTMKSMMAGAALAAMVITLSLPGMAIAKDVQVGVADQVFAMMAAKGGQVEVQLSKLATDRAGSPEVKQLAQRLVQDHTKANQELMAVAKEQDISLPKSLDDTHEAVVKLFSKLEGAQFDREFLRYQVMHHEKDTAAFSVQAKDGQDPALKAFAAKQLPIL